MLARFALLIAVSVLVAGCGGDDEGPARQGPEPAEQRAPATTDTAAAEDVERCASDEAGFTVAYPADWHTNSGEVAPACSYFDPEPFEVPRAQEFFGAAISIRREPVPFSRATGDDLAVEVVERDQVRVDGRPAVRRLTRATGEGLLEEGTRTYQYLVDLDGETLMASTVEGGDRDFERNREALDRMVERLQIDGG